MSAVREIAEIIAARHAADRAWARRRQAAFDVWIDGALDVLSALYPAPAAFGEALHDAYCRFLARFEAEA